MNHVFGPVPSRRFGRSLGVDLVPFKVCSLDCVYCQLGRTTDLTLERRSWVPFDEVVADLAEGIARNPDVITLSGSGEPTLHDRIGDVIDTIRSMTDIPVAVLTNGTTLWQPEVRRQLRNASYVVPSLDAGGAEMFRTVNRPHRNLDFDRIVDGLAAFRTEYKGKYWLEVMLLPGLTANFVEVQAIAALVGRIKPDRVQINTAVRPAPDPTVVAAETRLLKRLAELFPCPAEVIADHPLAAGAADAESEGPAILNLLFRRPCTIDDVAGSLQLRRAEVIKHLDTLHRRGIITRRRAGDKVFYCSAGEAPPDLRYPAKADKTGH